MYGPNKPSYGVNSAFSFETEYLDVMLLKIIFFLLSTIFINSALIRITRSFLVNEFTELHTGTLNVKRSTCRVTHHKVDQQLVSR